MKINNTDTIELLRELTEAGEASIDMMCRVHEVLREYAPDLSGRFTIMYTRFYNDEIDEIDEDFLKEIYKALGGAPQIKPAVDEIDKLMKSLDK